MILAFANLVANMRALKSTRRRKPHSGAPIADPQTPTYTIVNAIASQVANMQFRPARKIPIIKLSKLNNRIPTGN
jgi:hypothetical protein